MERVYIFDSTLRDGEQTAGVGLTAEDKLKIAQQLERLGVDTIEAGFPISSPGDFKAVQLVAQKIKKCTVAGLARALKGDIDACWEAVKSAVSPRIHVFLATSEIHMQYKLKKAREEILRMAVESVKAAKKYTNDVEFSPEDASRTDPEFLCKVVEVVIDAGATVVNIPDTVGYALPTEMGRLIRYIKENVPNIDKVVISVHCHNDLGLATANSIAAVEAGATQVECTINGIGERAGNASLEEIVMTIKTRKSEFNKFTGINTKEIYRTSRVVSRLTGLYVQLNKAIVGDNAFAHSSGIHLDGILKDRRTYEIMKPEDVGVKGHKMVLTARSGRHALREKLKEMGYQLNDRDFEKTYEMFLNLADKKREVFDEDLKIIVEDEIFEIPEVFSLQYVNVVTGNKTIPTATVRIKKNGKILEEAACGDGPVDAVYKAIDRATQISTKLLDYSIKSVTSGKEALGEVTVRIRSGGEEFVGRSASTDIIEASAKAYLKAVNRAYRSNKPHGR
ncbi:MAG TPA: 2-isopropylmalate synthase [Candidatus Omnitrophica bacterium]|nr:2-isopropylmalate synthase [Candidatus Omnitrophota bacterium]